MWLKELWINLKCKLGYHEWVAVHSYEYRQRPRRAIFSHKGGRKKAQYYTKRKTKYYCNNLWEEKKMIKRLEGIQKGQQVYIIPSDPRHNPYYTRVISVGPKKN